MNDMYYIEISELPVISSRTQKQFDEIILEYIEKFKTITNNKKTIAHLIATSIDYPLEYVKEAINSYVRSGLLTTDLEILSNKEAFVREKIYINSYKTLYLIYDRKNDVIKELEETQINEYKVRREKNDVELDNKDYFKIYSYLFDNDNFFDRTTKEKDKYLMSLTIKKVDKANYKSFFKEKIKFYPLTVLTEEQVATVKRPSNIYSRKLGQYKQDYKFLNTIKEKQYYQYNLASSNSNNSNICDTTIEELLDIAKESIFIITTNIRSEGKETKAFNKINTIRNNSDNKNIYIRTIEGFETNNDLIIVDQDKNYYSQIFSNMIHSKIIIVDNFFVALGSGNWFSSSRDKWEDSLVIFPCEHAIKKYCPIYDPKGDYYNIFTQLIDKKDNLHELFDLYLIMKKDLTYDMSNNKNIYDEILIKKIEKSIESNIKNEFDYIVDFLKKENVNSDEFYYYLTSSEKIDNEYKEKLKRILISRGDE